MAGILPGVECARRRRLHQSKGFLDLTSSSTASSTRRTSFCLYAANHEPLHSFSSSSLLHRSVIYHAQPDLSMVGEAREARQRLDDKFRSQRKSEYKSIKCSENRQASITELHTEVYGSKKSGSRRFNWSKLRWKASEQEDCAVCLELFKVGETLMHLPCAHKFHSKCLNPWFENNSHCPCCRTAII
ncbi:hypothetical protein HN51_036378 [Arachis hypogaea]|uniref:RING-type domain-containing protein n=2 Tax=Arachis hypogaea TaxID=3818 RepID=A0A445A0B7_ARAHY|nr:probable E3 ubiquitin-protein ligase RHY1A [Arachis ipaensis]XP_025636782.1 probable E3 ubiquitin-protein ligase RHY1A isoform X1 [Arachis hypogaea]RYR19877.1 hypothetical protein Ahy_B03g064784 isoform A [Arachis hypogaea]RYR19878.1 hypothetical protein Ahy_B03g064784 isoform B [Arachis hypogaea]